MADDKRQLRQECYRIAHNLINRDDIERGAVVLAYYRRKFAENDDVFLRRGLPLLFILDLVQNCRRHQTRRVCYLIDEHFLDESLSYRQVLRRYQLIMFLRLADMEGAIWCMKQFLRDANNR